MWGLALGLAASACRREPPPPSEPQETVVAVGAVRAETSAIRAVVRASGVVTPAEGAEFLVVAPEPARIVEITKAEGEAAKSGEMLARFDLPSSQQDVARLSADLAAAQALLENTRVNNGRVRDFVERGLVPRRDLEAADRDLADAQAAVERARAAHTAAEAKAARAIVRAPFDGVVATRRHNPGDVVLSSSTDPVLRLVDPKRLDAVAFVPQDDVSRVVPGASARVTSAPAPVPLRVVKRLADRLAPTGTLEFQLAFIDAATTLPVDSRIEIEIDAEERAGVVVVPPEALLRDGAQTFVMVAAGSRAERRVVTLGIQDDERVEIASGLRSGEMVITRGHLGLADGAAISVAQGR